MVFWPDLNIHIVLLRKLAKYCKYIWYILRTTDFLYWGYAIPVSAEAHCIVKTRPLYRELAAEGPQMYRKRKKITVVVGPARDIPLL
jgi:hypothetical protein